MVGHQCHGRGPLRSKSCDFRCSLLKPPNSANKPVRSISLVEVFENQRNIFRNRGLEHRFSLQRRREARTSKHLRTRLCDLFPSLKCRKSKANSFKNRGLEHRFSPHRRDGRQNKHTLQKKLVRSILLGQEPSRRRPPKRFLLGFLGSDASHQHTVGTFFFSYKCIGLCARTA